MLEWGIIGTRHIKTITCNNLFYKYLLNKIQKPQALPGSPFFFCSRPTNGNKWSSIARREPGISAESVLDELPTGTFAVEMGLTGGVFVA